METFMTPNGTVTIFDTKGIYEIAERYVGADFATAVKDMVDEVAIELEDYKEACAIYEHDAENADVIIAQLKDVLFDMCGYLREAIEDGETDVTEAKNLIERAEEIMDL